MEDDYIIEVGYTRQLLAAGAFSADLVTVPRGLTQKLEDTEDHHVENDREESQRGS